MREESKRFFFEEPDGQVAAGKRSKKLLSQFYLGNIVADTHARAVAFKQRGVEFQLQLPNLGADGWLRAVTGLRRLGKTLETDDLKKRVKLIKIHGAVRALTKTGLFRNGIVALEL